MRLSSEISCLLMILPSMTTQSRRCRKKWDHSRKPEKNSVTPPFAAKRQKLFISLHLKGLMKNHTSQLWDWIFRSITLLAPSLKQSIETQRLTTGLLRSALFLGNSLTMSGNEEDSTLSSNWTFTLKCTYYFALHQWLLDYLQPTQNRSITST